MRRARHVAGSAEAVRPIEKSLLAVPIAREPRGRTDSGGASAALAQAARTSAECMVYHGLAHDAASLPPKCWGRSGRSLTGLSAEAELNSVARLPGSPGGERPDGGGADRLSLMQFLAAYAVEISEVRVVGSLET